MKERVEGEQLRRGEVSRCQETRKAERRDRKEEEGWPRVGERGRGERERPVVPISLAAFGLGRGRGAFR